MLMLRRTSNKCGITGGAICWGMAACGSPERWLDVWGLTPCDKALVPNKETAQSMRVLNCSRKVISSTFWVNRESVAALQLG